MSEEERMEKAGMTAETYMSWAITAIDKQLGDGYARQHPELIGAFMQAAASDYLACHLGYRLELVSAAIGEHR